MKNIQSLCLLPFIVAAAACVGVDSASNNPGESDVISSSSTKTNVEFCFSEEDYNKIGQGPGQARIIGKMEFIYSATSFDEKASESVSPNCFNLNADAVFEKIERSPFDLREDAPSYFDLMAVSRLVIRGGSGDFFCVHGTVDADRERINGINTHVFRALDLSPIEFPENCRPLNMEENPSLQRLYSAITDARN